jgi:endogenous inhibitor of DNA gyrase (YacG/DUF329 family)
MEQESPIKGCAVEGRNVNIIICNCPGCGSEVEMFSDEKSTKCAKCGKTVAMEECQANAM